MARKVSKIELDGGNIRDLLTSSEMEEALMDIGKQIAADVRGASGFEVNLEPVTRKSRKRVVVNVVTPNDDTELYREATNGYYAKAMRKQRNV